jgi:hypothetical protein
MCGNLGHPHTSCIELNKKMVVNDELGRMWRWAWNFKVFFQQLPGGTDENHKNS